MNNRGIIRRIDELGRIVIPKEMRRMLSIRDGENIEINIEHEQIVLKKYNYLKTIEDLGKQLVEIYTSVSENSIIITDREKVIISKSNYVLNGKKLDKLLIDLIDSRQILIKRETIKFSDQSIESDFIINPIINETDCIGLIIIFGENIIINNEEQKIIRILSKILSGKINIC